MKNYFYLTCPYAFCGEQAWRLSDNARPSDFPSPKSWVSELFFWGIVYFYTSNGSFRILKKAGRKFSKIRLFPQFLKMMKIIKIYFLQPFSIFWKGSLLPNFELKYFLDLPFTPCSIYKCTKLGHCRPNSYGFKRYFNFFRYICKLQLI